MSSHCQIILITEKKNHCFILQTLFKGLSSHVDLGPEPEQDSPCGPSVGFQ